MNEEIYEEEIVEEPINWKQKLSSRVFWLCAAAFLVAVATAIGNTFSGNETAAVVAGVCTILAAGIYAAAEKATDIARIKADTCTTEIVQNSTTSVSNSTAHTQNVEAKSNDTLTVATVLAPAPVTEEPTPVMEDE